MADGYISLVTLPNGDLYEIDAVTLNRKTATDIAPNANSTSDTIPSSTAVWSAISNITFPVTSINGCTGDVTLDQLGLSNALHFIGITTTTMTDGSTTGVITINNSSVTATTGDVVMDNNEEREYVWSGSLWYLLGFTASTIYSCTASNTNSWIASVQQTTDGKVNATTAALDTSGDWTGTAGSWKNDRKLYTALDTASTAATINGSTAGAGAVVIGVTGTLPIGNGGLGNTSFTNNCVIVPSGTPLKFNSVGLNVSGATNAAVTIKSNSANSLFNIQGNGTGKVVITSNTGGVTITSTTGAINISSTTGAMTLSTGKGNLEIKSTSGGTVKISGTTALLSISSNYGSLVLLGGAANTTTYSILTLGNATASNVANLSEGKIVLYSSTTYAHTIIGEAASAARTHTLPNATGWLVTSNTAGVGDAYTPVYADEDGVLQSAAAIQRVNFTFSTTGNVTSTFSTTHAAITSDTEVIEIVVESGCSYLKSPINWSITSVSSALTLLVTASTNIPNNQTITGYVYIAHAIQL